MPGRAPRGDPLGRQERNQGSGVISYCRAQPGELEQFSLLDSGITIFQPDLWVCFRIKHIPSVDSHLYLLCGVCLSGLSSSSSAIRKLSQASPCSQLHLPPSTVGAGRRTGGFYLPCHIAAATVPVPGAGMGWPWWGILGTALWPRSLGPKHVDGLRSQVLSCVTRASP